MTQTAFPFDNTYARLPSDFFSAQPPVPVASPSLVAVNRPLAEALGLTLGDDADMARIFAGNALPEGAEPIAQAYAGHQFGGFSPRLGDGRATLLGEVLDASGARRDIQLKGSGPTPWSRGGDGRAWLGPVLREYVLSEAMHALGIPSTRALAAVRTGEDVWRQEGALPGAVLTRVAASHIRVGTFQYFAARRDLEGLARLFGYAKARHYPDAEGPADFLRAVITRQAMLVAKWMGVGFIHGVMNTDNTSISGETIDYGPCAFMDRYFADQVFSSIDRQGRYAYSNQPHLIVWNMAQLATALVPLMPDQDAAIAEFTEIVHAMPGQIEAEWLRVFGAKIGLAAPKKEDRALIEDLLKIMEDQSADFTNTFRALARGEAAAQFTDPAPFEVWHKRWQTRIAEEEGWRARMKAANPAVIPRNHRVEKMIAAAAAGDDAPFNRMLEALAHPFVDRPEAEYLTHPPLPSEIVRQTFCGT